MAERIEEQIAAIEEMNPTILQEKLIEILQESPFLIYNPPKFLDALIGVEISRLDEEEKEKESYRKYYWHF